MDSQPASQGTDQEELAKEVSLMGDEESSNVINALCMSRKEARDAMHGLDKGPSSAGVARHPPLESSRPKAVVVNAAALQFPSQRKAKMEEGREAAKRAIAAGQFIDTTLTTTDDDSPLPQSRQGKSKLARKQIAARRAAGVESPRELSSDDQGATRVRGQWSYGQAHSPLGPAKSDGSKAGSSYAIGRAESAANEAHLYAQIKERHEKRATAAAAATGAQPKGAPSTSSVDVGSGSAASAASSGGAVAVGSHARAGSAANASSSGGAGGAASNQNVAGGAASIGAAGSGAASSSQSQMEIDPPRCDEHPVWGKQMCLAGDATQLKPPKENNKLLEVLTTDGDWYTRDPKHVTVALEEAKRYGDQLMADGMRALSWGDAESEAWLALKAKALGNSLPRTKAQFLCGTNEAAMNLWFHEVAWEYAAELGATVANGKVFVSSDPDVQRYDSKSVNKLRGGGYEKMVFIIGVPFLYAGSEDPLITDEIPEPLELADDERATGATLLVPTRFVRDGDSGETIIMVKPFGNASAAEVVFDRHIRSYGKSSEAWFAQSCAFKAKPFQCVVPHIVQGMQFPNGAIISMLDWWPCDHMLYVAMSRATSSDLVQLLHSSNVTPAQWAKYTMVDPRAVLLRAWGGEQPPAHVLGKALRLVKKQVISIRAKDPTYVHRAPYDLNDFVVGGGMKGASSKDRQGRRGLCGKWLTYKQCVAIDVLNAGFTLVLIGAAGTGKTLVLTEWALHLELKEEALVWRLLSATSPTHASGGRLRTDMEMSSLRLKVGTVSARYGLGVSNAMLGSAQIERIAGSLKAVLKTVLRKKYGIIDEAMLLTPHRAGVCAEVQRRVIEMAQR